MDYHAGHAQCQRAVGAGTQLQVNVRQLRCGRQPGIDIDDFDSPLFGPDEFSHARAAWTMQDCLPR